MNQLWWSPCSQKKGIAWCWSSLRLKGSRRLDMVILGSKLAHNYKQARSKREQNHARMGPRVRISCFPPICHLDRGTFFHMKGSSGEICPGLRFSHWSRPRRYVRHCWVPQTQRLKAWLDIWCRLQLSLVKVTESGGNFGEFFDMLLAYGSHMVFFGQGSHSSFSSLWTIWDQRPSELGGLVLAWHQAGLHSVTHEQRFGHVITTQAPRAVSVT